MNKHAPNFEELEPGFLFHIDGSVSFFVEGQVVDGMSRPVADVVITDTTERDVFCRTNSDGEFRLSITLATSDTLYNATSDMLLIEIIPYVGGTVLSIQKEGYISSTFNLGPFGENVPTTGDGVLEIGRIRILDVSSRPDRE